MTTFCSVRQYSRFDFYKLQTNRKYSLMRRRRVGELNDNPKPRVWWEKLSAISNARLWIKKNVVLSPDTLTNTFITFILVVNAPMQAITYIYVLHIQQQKSQLNWISIGFHQFQRIHVPSFKVQNICFLDRRVGTMWKNSITEKRNSCYFHHHNYQHNANSKIHLWKNHSVSALSGRL